MAVRPLDAVLDTCVLVPSRVRDTLLDLALEGLYRCHWSEETLNELYRNLVTGERQRDHGVLDLINALRGAFPEGTVSARRYRAVARTIAVHPKDRHVLAAAIACDAVLIVTDNVRDFPPTALREYGVTAITADRFLLTLWRSSAPRIVNVLQAQAARYQRPAMTLPQLLDRLHRTVPTFVAAVREQGGST